MISRRFQYFFRRDEVDDLDPKMYMRKPVDGGAEIKATVVLGRGRDHYVRTPGSSSQRVTVKTKIQPAAKAVAHARYLEKEAAGLDGAEVHVLTATKDDVDLKEMTEEWSEDRHHFQVIISPEHADRLDMRQYVRDVVARYERDLGTELTWASVIHCDTERPHAHVMIRGVDDRGADLVIDREYLRHGMRHRAREVATQDLGPRSAREIVADLEKHRKDVEAGLGHTRGLGKQAGWQLHLNVPSQRWHPVTQAVMKDLTERGLPYHMKFGSQDSKVLTISVGGYDDAVKVARELDAQYGDRIPGQVGKVTRDDVRLSGPVWGAFSAQGDREFTRWTVKGVPLDKGESRELRDLDGPARDARRNELRETADAKLIERYGEFYAGSERIQALEKLQELQRDVGHGY